MLIVKLNFSSAGVTPSKEACILLKKTNFKPRGHDQMPPREEQAKLKGSEEEVKGEQQKGAGKRGSP